MKRLFVPLAVLAAPAQAPAQTLAQTDEMIFFRSPSANIQCMIATGQWAEARCDVMEVTKLSYPVPPADCELDWGHAFAVGPTGGAEPACVGDTVASPDAMELGYGKSVQLGGFRCVSEKTGMTCVNGQGHGFTVAKASQKMF